jgi:peptidoglycan/xylan/chitin deacetylase (PgdA/CDA1 family)
MRALLLFCLLIIFSIEITAQSTAFFYNYGNDDMEVREFLVTQKQQSLVIPEAATQFLCQQNELGEIQYQHLTVAGDFDGDGIDEIALFIKNYYHPNCFASFSCPPYYCSQIILLKPYNHTFRPCGTWFSTIDSDFDLAKATQAVSADFNGDGKCDIALVVKGNGVDAQAVSLMTSNGREFVQSNGFDFSQSALNPCKVEYLLKGTFNNDATEDLCVVVENENDESFNMYLLANDGTSFSNSGLFATLSSYDIVDIQSVDDQLEAYSKIVVAGINRTSNKQELLTFSYLTNQYQLSASISEISTDVVDFKRLLFSNVADMNNDGIEDLAWASTLKKEGNKLNKMTIIQRQSNGLAVAIDYLSVDSDQFNMNKVEHVVCGNFETSNPVDICTWQGNQKGAVTFSFDDGYAETLENAKYLHTKNLSGTHNVISHESGNAPYASWNDVISASANFEIASHSYTHERLNQITPEESDNQLTLSKEELEAQLNVPTEAFVFPGGGFSYDILQSAALRNNYLSARTSMRGDNLSSPLDEYALKSKIVLNTTDIATIQGWIDRAQTYGYWTFLMYHYIGYTGTDPDLIEYNSTVPDFEAIVDYASSKDVWVDKHSSIMKYITERNAAQILGYSTDNKSVVKFYCDDNLDDQVYNIPLSLQLTIPSDWDVVNLDVAQNHLPITYHSVSSNDGISKILVDALPDNTLVTIAPHTATATQPTRETSKSSVMVIPSCVETDAKIYVSVNSPSSCTVDIVNTTGRTVASYSVNETQQVPITRSGLASGVYLVILKQNSEIIAHTKMIVK